LSKLSPGEKKLLKSVEKGEWKPVPNPEPERKRLPGIRRTAERTVGEYPIPATGRSSGARSRRAFPYRPSSGLLNTPAASRRAEPALTGDAPTLDRPPGGLPHLSR
jgi:hypothetical protein